MHLAASRECANYRFRRQTSMRLLAPAEANLRDEGYGTHRGARKDPGSATGWADVWKGGLPRLGMQWARAPMLRWRSARMPDRLALWTRRC